jgi:ParB-like chromosome segregation protein Spo0J
LSEVPVVVRELSDEEAFEESLAENLDREDMAPVDELRAVARLAADHGVQEAARRLGKPHGWVSKRKRIVEAPGFVLDFLERGGSSDVEALYELAKLADSDAGAAEAIIAGHEPGSHLREQVKAAARASRADSDADGEPASSRNGDTFDEPGGSEDSFQLEDRAAAAAAMGADDEDEDAGSDED